MATSRSLHSVQLRPAGIEVETPAIVFDIGGTWFRSGVLSSGNALLHVSRQPAPNYKNTAYSDVSELQEALLAYLVSEAHRLHRHDDSKPRLVGISMGAAMNAHTGLILNSGPLWGPNSRPLDLLGALRTRAPEFVWSVVNDVTASLLHEVSKYRHSDLLKVSLLTVSTGIACRTYDLVSNTVPVEPVHGLQGEIGHLPIRFSVGDKPLDLRCDCGEWNHLNAYCSGRGLENLLPRLISADLPAFRESVLCQWAGEDPSRVSVADFAHAVRLHDAFSMRLLDAATLPLAQIFLSQFVLDPHVQKVIVVGGVAEKIGPRFVASIVGNLNRLQMYQVSNVDSAYFKRRFELVLTDDSSGLMGAGYEARRTLDTYVPLGQTGLLKWEVSASLPISYSVEETEGVLDSGNPQLSRCIRGTMQQEGSILVLMDSAVSDVHGERTSFYLSSHGIDHRIVRVETSEHDKTLSALTFVLDQAVECRLGRNMPMVAIGGGVLLDIVGLAASLYRRGVPYIRIPTTLVGMIDAGIGVKTAVNYGRGKNRIGTYYPPAAVIIDRRFLATLDERQIVNGLAEILKVALVRDAELFRLLERHGHRLIDDRFQSGGIGDIVLRRAIQGMLEELAPNLRETDLDRLMDFGHTYSPLIEMRASPPLQHGEAVAIDMAISTVISTTRGLLSRAEQSRVIRVMQQLGMPTVHALCEPEVLWEALCETVAHRGGQQRAALPGPIGLATFVNDLSRSDMAAAALELKRLDDMSEQSA